MNGQDTHKARSGRWIITVLLVSILYVLTYGPMIALSSRGWPLFSTNDKFGAVMYEFYRPVHWLHVGSDDEHRSPIGRAIDKYVCWWLDVMTWYK